MAAASLMRFEPTDKPQWRSSQQVTTDMLEDIVTFRKRYQDLPSSDKEFCRQNFSSAMAIECIYHLNIGELVGSQTKEGTEELIKAILDKKPASKNGGNGDYNKEETETMNTYAAMERLHKIFKDDMKGLLTVQQICEVHRVLMKGLHQDFGEIRTTEAFTTWGGKLHFYPDPADIEIRLYALIDRYCIYVDQLSSITKNSLEEVKHMFKCAARLLFDFVDTHPFGDGNGRMCRLLANYVLTLITPFPVGLYHTGSNQDRSGRNDYVNAIVQCRTDSERKPCDLAAMLVEGAWNGWRMFFETLECRHRSRNEGSVIVIQQSKLGDVEPKLQRIVERWPDISINTKEVTQQIFEAIRERQADISGLEQCDHSVLHVDIAPQAFITCHVFK